MDITHEFVKDFFEEINIFYRRKTRKHQTVFDPISVAIVHYLVNESYYSNSRTIEVSSYKLTSKIMTSRKRIRLRLEHLCKFKFLDIETSKKTIGFNDRGITKITIRPALDVALTQKWNIQNNFRNWYSTRQSIADYFASKILENDFVR